ncbi:hypothetical protein [Streptomyces roseicoloratus]|uniref:hypothetical protein n=1 Tax=Streptomyces roseicoloratus TaxID=2508722 RepID=UPI001009AF5E|nr:hypothetical protein [Streptomyces roseicoloratus]
MNARRVQAAEGVILAALKTRQTAAGVAIALESACLLQSPESAAEQRRTVIAERDAQIVAWLAKKAGEYGTSNRDSRTASEAVGRMADKLSRGAVRDDETGVSQLYGLRAENHRLVAEVRRLEAERHSTNEELSKAVERVAELEALTPAPIQTCRTCGAGYTYGQPCSTCEFEARIASELAARQLEDPHDSPLHHDYAVGRDLPIAHPTDAGSAL